MSKRTHGDTGEGGAEPTKRRRQSHKGNTGNGSRRGERVYHDRQVVSAFTRAGFTLESNEYGYEPLNQVRQFRHTVC